MANTGDPTRFWSTVTPSDTTNLAAGECNYLYVGGTGNITAICNGVAILFSNLAVGYHPIKCTRVNNTGTTATLILAAN